MPQRPKVALARFVAMIFLLFTVALHADPTAQQMHEIQQKLIEQQLYLRGFWTNDKLEFDGTGKLLTPSQAGPFTLSGVDVTDIAARGKRLLLKATRVTLAAGPNGELVRHRIVNSKTLLYHAMPFGFKPYDEYKAMEEMELLVSPDTSGSFDAALNAIFINGFAGLVAAVPPYWACYAKGHFRVNPPDADPDDIVARCVKSHSLAVVDEEGGPPESTPRPAHPLEVQASPLAAMLGLQASSVVHFTVSRRGIPVGFQIVRALGAGLDEQVLKAIYDDTFEPATRNDAPIAADFELTTAFSPDPGPDKPAP